LSESYLIILHGLVEVQRLLSSQAPQKCGVFRRGASAASTTSWQVGEFGRWIGARVSVCDRGPEAGSSWTRPSVSHRGPRVVLIRSTAKECPLQECVTILKAGVWLASEGNRLRPDEPRKRNVAFARGESPACSARVPLLPVCKATSTILKDGSVVIKVQDNYKTLFRVSCLGGDPTLLRSDYRR